MDGGGVRERVHEEEARQQEGETGAQEAGVKIRDMETLADGALVTAGGGGRWRMERKRKAGGA